MDMDAIRKFCLSLPQAKENLQWGDDLCFKIGGKLFAIVSLDAVPQTLAFKCAPERFPDLLENEDVVPAPYLGRYKWVMLERLDALPAGELQDLLKESYEMVAAKIPRKREKGKRSRSI